MTKYQVFNNQICEEDDVVISRKNHNWYRLVNALIGPITGSLILSGIMLGTENYRMNKELSERPQQVRIDRDELSDLIIGGKILLADQTGEGTVYRPLRDSDIYRIK